MKRFFPLNILIKIWYLLALVVFLGLIISIPGYFHTYFRQPGEPPTEPMTTFLIATGGLTSLLTALISLGLAVFLFARKRSDPMALFVSLFLLGYGLVMAGPLEILEAYFLGINGPISSPAQLLFAIPSIIVMFSFPTGTIELARIRPVLIVLPLLIPYIFWITPAEMQTISTLRSQILLYLMGFFFLGAIAGQIFRFRKISNQVQRQQTKVVVFGLILWGFLLFLSSIPYYFLNGSLGISSLPSGKSLEFLWFFSLLILPASLTFAIFRSHLWDIDVIIRRTLIYSLITATLTGIYFASVVIFQDLLSLFGSQQSPAAIVISTLIIAALFTPLHRRIQGLIDRRFYRQRYDAQQTLQAFSTRLKNEIDLEEMSVLLVSVVEKTVEPESISLWFCTDPDE